MHKVNFHQFLGLRPERLCALLDPRRKALGADQLVKGSAALRTHAEEDLKGVIAPRKVEVVKSDGGGEFLKGAFGALYTPEKIRQGFTTADSPQYNGVVELQIAIIEAAGLAARIQTVAKNPTRFFRAERKFVGQASSLGSSRIKSHSNFRLPRI